MNDDLQLLTLEDIGHYADIVAAAISAFSPKVSYEFAFEEAMNFFQSCDEINTDAIELCAKSIRESHELENVAWN